jgi:hypothetical protein
MRIYLDAASIHSEIARRHPEIGDGYVWLSRSNAPYFATFMDTSGCVDGPADIQWDERYMEDYHGFQIEMLRLRNTFARPPQEPT